MKDTAGNGSDADRQKQADEEGGRDGSPNGDPERVPSHRTSAPEYDVLVVDDMREVRRAVESHLRTQGASVLVAATGEQAVELARACCFKAVLTDYQLPGLSGAPLVEALRTAQPGARIVVMSGSGLTDEEIRLLAAAGMDGFLAKPFGLERLGEALLPQRVE